MRAVGIDLGEKRLGIAVSDPEGLVAVPHSVLELTSDREKDMSELIELIEELGAVVVIVGLPVGLRGEMGKSAQAAQAQAGKLQSRLSVPVVLHDERFSTVQAGRQLKAAGLNTKKARKRIDEAAACIILQSWLDSGQVLNKLGSTNG